MDVGYCILRIQTSMMVSGKTISNMGREYSNLQTRNHTQAAGWRASAVGKEFMCGAMGNLIKVSGKVTK